MSEFIMDRSNMSVMTMSLLEGWGVTPDVDWQ